MIDIESNFGIFWMKKNVIVLRPKQLWKVLKMVKLRDGMFYAFNRCIFRIFCANFSQGTIKFEIGEIKEGERASVALILLFIIK